MFDWLLEILGLGGRRERREFKEEEQRYAQQLLEALSGFQRLPGLYQETPEEKRARERQIESLRRALTRRVGREAQLGRERLIAELYQRGLQTTGVLPSLLGEIERRRVEQIGRGEEAITLQQMLEEAERRREERRFRREDILQEMAMRSSILSQLQQQRFGLYAAAWQQQWIMRRMAFQALLEALLRGGQAVGQALGQAIFATGGMPTA